MFKQVNDLRAENASLSQQVEKLQQDNRALTAHAAEIETQLSESHEKPAPAETAPTPSTKRPLGGDEQENYNQALMLHHHKQYEQALTAFQAIADGGGSLSDRAAYWAGECQYSLKDFKSALETFRKVLEFPRSTKKDDAQMMIANSYLALGEKEKAKTEYEKLIMKYPASQYVKRAKAKMDQL